MQIEALLVCLISFWVVLLLLLAIPFSKYSVMFDRVTKARWRKDKDTLNLMLKYLLDHPEEWNISRGSAAFPKNGAKQIMLNQDRSGAWEYSLISFGGDFRPLNGYYEKAFESAINKNCSQKECQALLRTFYPEMTNLLLTKEN